MYEEFFNFSAAPFRLNPDPKFFFGSRSHNKAMAYLHYGLRQAEGFIVISGEIGAGKSILIGHLIDQLDRSNVVAAHLLTTNLEPTALLSHILSAFRIEPSGTGKSAEIEAFEDFLFDQMNRGRRVLLIVDEAQNLPIRTMEELRMLSNMDYDGTPLFQVFMVGQPEFRGILAEPHMEQFRQRIIASYHLEPLGQTEMTDYIRHRLALVGWNNDPSISDEAYRAIFIATGGVPRKINKLCNRILLYCSLEKLHAIDEAVVKAVVTDLKSENIERSSAQAAEAAPKATEPAPAAPEPVVAKSVEVQKPVEAAREAQRETKTANGATNGASNGSGAAKPSDKPVAPRAPVVIPFGAVKKAPPAKAGENGASKPDSDAKPAAAAEKKAEAEKPAVKAAEKPAEIKKSETAEKPAGKAEAAPKKEGAVKPAESEEPKSKAAEEAAMPKKTDKPAAPAQAVKTPAPEAKPAAPATTAAPATVADIGAMSVLDRLRAQRSGGAAPQAAPEVKPAPAPAAAIEPAPAKAAESETERESDRAPATLLDVAKAIEAVSAAGEAARKEAKEATEAEEVAAPPLEADDADDAEALVEPLGEPPLSIDPKGWRLSIVKSINETRDELKSAHANVARLRKQLGAIDSRRREKRLKIAANLARAESLLTEIRNAWR